MGGLADMVDSLERVLEDTLHQVELGTATLTAARTADLSKNF